MTGSTISSTSAAITSQPANIEPSGPRPSRPGPRSPAWPLGHKPSCDRPPCALSRPEPIKLTVPAELPGPHRKRADELAPNRLRARSQRGGQEINRVDAAHFGIDRDRLGPSGRDVHR